VLVALAVVFAGAACRAAALATVVAFLVERAVVVAGADFTAADALRPPLAGAALAAVALVPRATLVAPVEAVPRAAAARPVDWAGALAAATFLAAALRPAAFFELSANLNPAAGLKRMPLEAAIFTGWPVRGLRPVRALRCVGLKLPKPYMVTRLPDRTWSPMVATKASTACSAWRRVRPVVVTISSTNWERFNAPPMCGEVRSFLAV